ncbi:zinc ribbon domain-containing protein [Epidermidibacterium keratini]|uniref:Zinc ribbon domain-containing protein n=2 Tax=Epidermidibacterium keratini TaxID=1891644 RepID=A0A7L4YHW0_9ACTN|nr:zinc ribbon domain-containing protein [Epidermidibacterium keratini]
MPLYEFRCAKGTSVERSFPIAEVPDSLSCECCGGPAARRISAPRLSAAGSPAYRAVEQAARSAHEPDVVSTTSPGRSHAPPVTRNPLHSKLPRP